MLPKLVTPKYDMIVPSTGKSITYRPYVVKEEKILLIAIETESEIAIEKAVQDIIKACVESPINVNELTNFDVEFIFITLRSKSVGEGVIINPACEHCEERNEHKIDLEKVKVANLEDAVDKHIKLTDDISLDLKWHKMSDRLSEKERKTETDTVINMVTKSIETIYSGEEIFAAKDSTKKDLVEFVESLNSDQFTEIIDVISKAPRLSYKLNYDCKACSKKNEIELSGLIDFFQ
jgi:hypothetical protein